MIFAAFLSLFLLPFPFFLPLSHSPPANAKSSAKGDCTWVSLTEQECALYLTALFAPPCSALCLCVLCPFGDSVIPATYLASA